MKGKPRTLRELLAQTTEREPDALIPDSKPRFSWRWPIDKDHTLVVALFKGRAYVPPYHSVVWSLGRFMILRHNILSEAQNAVNRAYRKYGLNRDGMPETGLNTAIDRAVADYWLLHRARIDPALVLSKMKKALPAAVYNGMIAQVRRSFIRGENR